jgi:hypothetical protein
MMAEFFTDMDDAAKVIIVTLVVCVVLACLGMVSSTVNRYIDLIKVVATVTVVP